MSSAKSSKFVLSPSALELKSKCDKYQTSEICMEIAQAMQKDLTKKDVKEDYNRFLTQYIEYLKIKAKIETFTPVKKNPLNKCVFFDYSFLDDVRAHEENLMENIEEINKIVSMYGRYSNPITDKNMNLYNIYQKYLYQDLFSSIAPYYELLITQTLNYKEMRNELVANLKKNLENLNDEIRIVNKINEEEITSEEYRVLKKLNILLFIPKNLKGIETNTLLNDKQQAIIKSLKNDILKIYKNFCNIDFINLINDNVKYSVNYDTLIDQYRTKKTKINTEYIKYLKSNVPKSKKVMSVARHSIRRANAARTQTVKKSIGKSIMKTRKGSMPPQLVELSEVEKLQKTLDEADKINKEVEELLASLSGEYNIDLD